MTLSIVISAISVIGMIISILVKPYAKIGKVKLGVYCAVVFIGALVTLVTKTLPFDVAVDGILADTSVNPLKILVLFISMTLISIFLGDSGFFALVANKIFEVSKENQIKLFSILYFAVSFLTVFTSNDIIVLTFTPIILVFCSKAGISPMPYLFGEFISANTWSMALIVGNPTNIYLAGLSHITFFQYVEVMIFPAIVSGIVGYLALLVIFKKQLKAPPKPHDEKEKFHCDKICMTASLITLCVCIVFLAISDFLGIEMWIITLISFSILTLFHTVYDLIEYKSVKRTLFTLSKAPFELIPFVLSMFIIVLSLNYNGVTEIIGKFLIKNAPSDAISFGVLSTLSANLLNNIPMSVLFESIISSSSKYAVYGAIFGSNIGAFLTPIGALAGIMWTKILSEYKVKLSFVKFSLIGTTVAFFSVVFGVITLFLVL